MISDNEKLRLLVELDTEINKIQDLDYLLEEILKGARAVANADAGSIYLVQDGKLHIRYAQNDTQQKLLPKGEKLLYNIFSIPINNKSISGYVASTGELVNIPDCYAIAKDKPFSFDPTYDRISKYKTVSNLTIPLKVNTGQILGVIQIINSKGADGQIVPFNQQDEMMITHFAGNATIALQRTKLTRTIILRMIKMAELRDPKETGPHVNRVAGYSAEIYRRWALKKNIPARELERNLDLFRMAALLHDVGKVGISDVILKKPGRFTPEEYEIMKTHTLIGENLFSDMQSDFDELARIVALTHHENWDGTGYPGKVDPVTGEALVLGEDGKPLGLKGEEIPLWGRIVSVADVFDALSCKRVYKEAWAEDEVLAEMRKMSGSKFDPELVDIFFEALPAIKQISDRYPD